MIAILILTGYAAGALLAHILQRRENERFGQTYTTFEDNIEAILWPLTVCNDVSFRVLAGAQDVLRPVMQRAFPRFFYGARLVYH